MALLDLRRGTTDGARSAREVDRAQLAILIVLAAVAFGPLIGLLLRVAVKGGHFAGGDGYLVLDQMQYLNWLRQAGEHGLIENLYDLAPGPRTFLHPGLLLSGALNALGLGFIASYLVWKPVAVLVVWAGTLKWAGRFIADRARRAWAVALSLFFVSPLVVFGWTGVFDAELRFDFDFLAGELTATNYLWGYLFTAIAVGLLPLGLLAYERGARWPAAAAGLVISWLQPWQGATYLLIVAGVEAWRWYRAGRRPGSEAAIVCAATTLPLVYYLVLSQTDDSWRLAGEANDFGSWPLWVMVVVLAPLVVAAAFAWRTESLDFGALALRVWPLAALVVWLQPFGTFPAHAVQGLTIPLATLAFMGPAGNLRPAVIAAAVAALTVPGLVYRVDRLREAVNFGRQPFFLTDGEHAALRWLDASPARGGVLAPVYMGLLVPAHTQRETWVGAGSWTPDFDRRLSRAEELFAGQLSRPEAERTIFASGARFLLSDCHGRADIQRLVARVTRPPLRFGCATVWEIRR